MAGTNYRPLDKEIELVLSSMHIEGLTCARRDAWVNDSSASTAVMMLSIHKERDE